MEPAKAEALDSNIHQVVMEPAKALALDGACQS